LKSNYPLASPSKRNFKKNLELDLSTPLKVCFILSILYFFLFIKYNADFSDIFSIPRQIAYRRYTQDLVTPLILKFLRIILTTGTIFAAFELFRSSNLISKLYLGLILFDGLMSAGKAGPLIGIIFYFLTYFLLKRLFNQPQKIFTKRNLFYLILISTIIISSQFLRLKEFNIDNLIYVISRLFSYAFAGLNAFDFWLHNYSFAFENLQFGALTFEGFYDIIGLRERVQGVFQERVKFGNLPPTNIFTGYRILLMDFGLVGTVLFIATNGLILFYSMDKIKKFKYQWVPIATITISFFIWIFFASIYSSNTYLFGILISALYIWLYKTLKPRF
jgi:oligosaccharide repeat unit polymerase